MVRFFDQVANGIEWPVLLVDSGADVLVGRDPVHLRRFEEQTVEDPQVEVFDATGRRLVMRWLAHGRYSLEFLSQQPEPERLERILGCYLEACRIGVPPTLWEMVEAVSRHDPN